MNSTKTILMTAYAVNPYKGSEDGTGWNIPFEIAKENKVIVITRKNNRPEIERFYNENPNLVNLQNLSFQYFDLPTWLIFWKKRIGERGYVLYYYLWQMFIPFFIKRAKLEFDVCHALNFHSDSHPQFLWTLGKPVFWGPIGHHPPVPKQFILKNYSFKTLVKDRLYNAVKFAMRNFDPFYFISKWTAKTIFVINSKVNDSVKADPKKIIVIPAVANNSDITVEKEKAIFNVLSVGRFTYMKGFDLVVESFGQFYKALNKEDQKKVKLTLIGKGEEKNNIISLIEKNDLIGVINIIDWVEKDKMERIYLKGAVFGFGSHEGAGMVIPEALSYGLPVVCFDNEGPGELCSDSNAIKVKIAKYEDAVKDFAAAFLRLFENEPLRKEMAINAQEFAKSNFTWSAKAEIMNNAYSHYLNEISLKLKPLKK